MALLNIKSLLSAARGTSILQFGEKVLARKKFGKYVANSKRYIDEGLTFNKTTKWDQVYQRQGRTITYKLIDYNKVNKKIGGFSYSNGKFNFLRVDYLSNSKLNLTGQKTNQNKLYARKVTLQQLLTEDNFIGKIMQTKTYKGFKKITNLDKSFINKLNRLQASKKNNFINWLSDKTGVSKDKFSFLSSSWLLFGYYDGLYIYIKAKDGRDVKILNATWNEWDQIRQVTWTFYFGGAGTKLYRVIQPHSRIIITR